MEWYEIIYLAAMMVLGIINCKIYLDCSKKVNVIYKHFNRTDKISNLPEASKSALKDITSDAEELSAEKLLDDREEMNKKYALFTNLTSMFPLFGMLGTVMSLLSMTYRSGFEATNAFFSALWSTAIGIVFALIYKYIDSKISYKIDDIEKHMEYRLFSPIKGYLSSYEETGHHS